MTQDEVVNFYENEAEACEQRAADLYLMYSIQPNTFTEQEYIRYSKKAMENMILAKWMRKMKIIEKD